MKSRVADELHAMLKYRAFNVTGWLARSAEVRTFDLVAWNRAPSRERPLAAAAAVNMVKREGRGVI